MSTHRGMSVHVGLNAVDPGGYAGWSGELGACEFDAKDMAAIAKKAGFATRTLLTKKGTSAAVIEAIADAADTLKSGDTFLLTYAGHGSQVPDGTSEADGTSEESDGMDETWVLYDRELLDDELYALWASFPPGARIVMLSDSCHSGTMVRAIRRTVRPSLVRDTVFRTMPPAVRTKVTKANAALYKAIQAATPAGDSLEIGASVLLLSGCQDNQTAADGDRNGLFTGTVKQVWDNGRFKGRYRGFWRQISRRMPPTQSPNWYTTGARSRSLESAHPFSI